MEAYEFTSKGLRLVTTEPEEACDPNEVISASAAVEAIRHPPTPLNPKALGSDLPLTQKIQNTKITPKTVIQAAKARVSEITRELRYHDQLIKERSQLQRLLEAAKALPKTAKTH